MGQLDQPTVLLVGEGERMETALVQALERHRLLVEHATSDSVVDAAFAAAPDVLVLFGDAAADGGEAARRSTTQSALLASGRSRRTRVVSGTRTPSR